MIAVYLIVTAASLGTIVALGGVAHTQSNGNITVSGVELSVRLNDETDFPDTNGTVETCLASGTPGDHLSVIGEITINTPANRSDTPREVILQLSQMHNRTVGTIEDRGNVTTDVVWVLRDDETLSVGDTTPVNIRVQEHGRTVATTTFTVPVEKGSRTYDC
jgi:hypothetical protein